MLIDYFLFYNKTVIIIFNNFVETPLVLYVITGVFAPSDSTKVIPNDSIRDRFTYRSPLHSLIIFLLGRYFSLPINKFSRILK